MRRADQPREGGGEHPPPKILTPNPVGLARVALICAYDLAGADPSSPIGAARGCPRVRGNYPLNPRWPPSGSYVALDTVKAGMIQHSIGVGCLRGLLFVCLLC